MKFLLIRLHNIEKIFATIALVKAIKSKYPDAIIHYVTTKEFEEYLSKFSEIEKVFFVQGDITPLVLSLLKEKYSHTIDLQGNARTRFITSHLGQQFNANLIKYSYPNGLFKKIFSSQYFALPNLTSQFVKCTKDLQLSSANLKWYYPSTEFDVLKKDDLPMSHSLGYYCIDIENTKKENIINVINHIKFPVILLGTSSDSENAEIIKKQDPIKIYNACGKFTIGEQYNILKSSKLNIVYTELLIALSSTVNVSIINTNLKNNHTAELEPFCSNSGIKYQKATWLNENDINTRIKGILLL
jgi:ADP-heptose:LPS heptosyltransferase